jgi:hypothetical protein
MRIGVTGHQDIPAEALEYIFQGIKEVLDGVKDGLVGVSSLAVGADQIFASLVLERGGRLDVVLPSTNYEKTFSRSEDLRRFHSLLEHATTVETLSFAEPSEEAYLAGGCRVVDLSEVLLAVWDGEPAKGKGGTGDIVEYAKSRGARVEVVWPAGIARQ